MGSNTLFKDLIPYRAGAVKLTPLDNDYNPIYSESYTTSRDFITSTQRSTTFAYETHYNANGEASDYISQRRESLILTTQTFDPKLDAMLLDKSALKSSLPVLIYTDIILSPSMPYYKFDEQYGVPVALSDGLMHIEVRDNSGLRYAQVSEAPSDGQFSYNPETHMMRFSQSAASQQIRCSYYIYPKVQETYCSSTIVKNRVFMVEVFGELMSASNESKQLCYTKIERATLSGETKGVVRKKGVSEERSYTFVSAPVRRGEPAVFESFSVLSGTQPSFVNFNPILDDAGTAITDKLEYPSLSPSGLMYFS